MRDHGPWKIRNTHPIYSDPYITVTKDDVVRPDGHDGAHVKVFMKPGVSVLALDKDEDLVYLTNEFHYAIGKESIEVVSGGVEEGESTEWTAKRELKEELGIVANTWQDLGTIDPFTTIIESPTRLFVASDLSFTDTELEGTEQIECIKLPFNQALQMVMDGDIFHAPSCVAILKVAMQRLQPTDF